MIKISQEQMKKVRENNDKDEEIKLLKSNLYSIIENLAEKE